MNLETNLAKTDILSIKTDIERRVGNRRTHLVYCFDKPERAKECFLNICQLSYISPDGLLGWISDPRKCKWWFLLNKLISNEHLVFRYSPKNSSKIKTKKIKNPMRKFFSDEGGMFLYYIGESFQSKPNILSPASTIVVKMRKSEEEKEEISCAEAILKESFTDKASFLGHSLGAYRKLVSLDYRSVNKLTKKCYSLGFDIQIDPPPKKKDTISYGIESVSKLRDKSNSFYEKRRKYVISPFRKIGDLFDRNVCTQDRASVETFIASYFLQDSRYHYKK